MLTYNTSKCNDPSLTINLMQLPPSSRCFPYSVPPLHFVWGNPRNRSAGGHTRHAHRRVSFTHYATRSPKKEQHLSAHLYCTHKASTHNRQANDSTIYKMKAQSFVWRKKGTPRQKANNWHKWQLWLKALCVTQAWRSIRSAPCASTLQISRYR